MTKAAAEDTTLSQREMNAWPPMLRRLVGIIGRAKTLQLADRVGGVDRVQIPRVPTTSHFWRSILGDEAWSKVVDALAGERIDLPRGVFLSIKKWMILELAEEGMKHRQIALQVRCTERYVREVLRGLPKPKDDRQVELFASQPAKRP